MATLFAALRRGILEEYALPSWETRPKLRCVYVASQLIQWVDSTPDLLHESIGPRLLIEHLEQLFCDFSCSERPPAGDVRRMMPTRHGVLSVHAPGLRVYGWCYTPGCLLATDAALEQATKEDRTLNDHMRDNVLAFARRHNLENTIRKGELYELFPAGS